MNQQNPLTDEQLNEIAESHPGPDWYGGEWRTEYVDSTEDSHGHYVVKHQESGHVLAELPDFAGTIALFIADAHDSVPALLAEVRRQRAERNRYRNAWHNARARAADGWGDAKLAEARVGDLEAGRRADHDRIAELEPYERLNPQQCPAGKHADWLVDSEYAHACPWCEIERQRAELAAMHTKVLAVEADQIVAHCPDHGSKDGVWMDCHCAVADDMRRRTTAASAVAVSGGEQ